MTSRRVLHFLSAYGLISAFAAQAASTPGLSKASVEQALVSPDVLARVRIRLAWGDAESCEIAGDGSVFVWRRETGYVQPHLPAIMATLRRKLPTPTVAAIVRLFADERFLANPIPPKHPNLPCYTLRLTVPGFGDFECKHPDLALASQAKEPGWVELKGPQDPTASRIIYAIREAVAQLEEQVRVEEGKALSREALLRLADDTTDNLWLELELGGFWASFRLRLAENGEVSGFDDPRGPNARKAPIAARIPREKAQELIRTAIRENVLDHVQRQRTAIVDSAWWALSLEAKANGATCRRTLWLWTDEVKEAPAFHEVQQAMLEIHSAWKKQRGGGKAP